MKILEGGICTPIGDALLVDGGHLTDDGGWLEEGGHVSTDPGW